MAKAASEKKSKKDDYTYDVWNARISLAKAARQPLIDDGNKNIDNYEGKILAKGYKNTIAVNLVVVDMKQSVPESYAQNPKIFVDPDEPGAESDAHIAELAINKKWGDLKMKPLCRDAIKSVKLRGMCGFKTYFNFSEDFIRDEWDDRIQNDEVRTDFISLKYLLKAPGSPSWKASPWIAHEISAPRQDIADKFDLDTKDVAITGSDNGADKLPTGVKDDFAYGTYYEIEDRQKGKLFYIVEGSKLIHNLKDKSYPYDSMYDFLMYNDIPERADPIADFSFWRDQLVELATYRTMEIAHARKGNSKYITTGKKLSEGQKTQLKNSDDATVVELSTDQRVEQFLHAALDPQLFQAENACRQDIQIISRQAPRQMAGDSKTATEVKTVEAAAQQVSGENLDRLEEVLASIATKWVALMQKNYTATRMIGLTGRGEADFMGLKESLKDVVQGDAKHPFVAFTNKNISKKLKVRIKAGSTAPDNDQLRMAKFQGFAQFVATAQLQAGVDVEELLKEATEIFQVENDNLLIRKDNPMEESRLLNSGVYVAPKIGEKHEMHLPIHERESNNSDANMIHIMGHKMFKAQVDAMAKAQAVTAPQASPQPTGASMLGTAPLPGGPEMGGMVPPAGQPAMSGPVGPPSPIVQ